MAGSSLFELLIAAAAACLIASLLVLTLVLVAESKIRAPHFGQLFCGCFLLFMGLRGLWWARFAIPRRTPWVPRYPNWQSAAWMDPWKAAAVFLLISVGGGIILVSGIRITL